MGDSLEFDRYVRTPFQVKAVRITEENIDEVAKLVGEVEVEEGKKFIAINRKIVPTIGRAFIGWYLTKSGDSLRCYSPKVFKQQFMTIEGSNTVTWAFPDDVSKPPKKVGFGGVEKASAQTLTDVIINGEVSIDPIGLPGTSVTVVDNPVDVQTTNVNVLDDGHKTVNLSVGEPAQYDPKTD